MKYSVSCIHAITYHNQSETMIQKQQKSREYLSINKQKSAGAHYTPTILADFVAKQILEVLPQRDKLDTLRILDPGVGDGELLLSILRHLPQSHKLGIKVFGFDTDQDAVNLASERINKTFPQVLIDLKCADFLKFALNFKYPDLFNRVSFSPVDLVIANPPYVRTQVMGTRKSQQLAQQFGLSGRVDLYYAFIRGTEWMLRPGGIAGIIVSNRFMKTKSGASVRENILEKFDIIHVWDLGDTRLFEAAVLPAVLLIRRKDDTVALTKRRFTSIYSAKCSSPNARCSNVIAALKEDGIVELDDGKCYRVQHGILDHGQKSTGIWRITTEASAEWLKTVSEHTFSSFGDIGKVRVGVKTTADKVFIRQDWNKIPEDERPELLRPVITHHIARRFRAIKPEKPWQILYTHKVVGGKRTAVSLKDHPKSTKYLNRHRSVLEGREYLLNAGRNWYEIWVPQDPNMWIQPKIVFRDISQRPTFWMDLSGSVVNGDCYWLVCHKSERIDLLWLALAVGNSSFIEKFYDCRFNNKLYAGRRRFITQYVKHFPLPNPKTKLSQQIIQSTQKIYSLTPSNEADELEKEVDRRVWQAFGLSVEKVFR